MPRLHKIGKAGEELGISEYAMRKIVRAGKMPIVMIGNCQYIPDDELGPFVARNKVSWPKERKATKQEH